MDRRILNRQVLSVAVMVILYFAMTAPAYSATYYVRTDGGSATQCTGLADAKYPGSGTGQACAFSHPFWAIAPDGNNPTKLQGGDTLIIDGANGAEYMIGYGAPNTGDTSKCHLSWPYSCTMRSVPSGTAEKPTRILGKGWDTGCASPPQLWGTHRVYQILALYGSKNVEIQCLEITDHSSCQGRSSNRDIPCTQYTEPYADKGIVASDSENVLIKNVNIHGLSHTGIHAGRLKDWTLENVEIRGNTNAGWDGDIGANVSSNSGSIIFDNVTIEYNGCGETYPGEEVFGCCSQSQGCYGDGLGTHATGGDWYFHDSNISHNTSDGLDLLYHNGNGIVTIKRSRFEGNAGQAVKSSAPTHIENSLIFGNCGYFSGKPFTSTRPTGFDNCRANGDTVALAYGGVNSQIYNSTLSSDGNILILSQGNSCAPSDKIVARNNIFIGGPKFAYTPENTTLYWASGSDGNGTGTCGSLPFDNDYSIIGAGANQTFKNQSIICANKGANSLCADPKFAETSTDMFFKGEAFNASLKSDSPAIGKALLLTGKSSLDYNSNDRGTVWDIGAIEYGIAGTQPTCASDAKYCTTQSDCTAQGHYWYNNMCNMDPEAEPTCAENIQYCLTQIDCQNQGYYWYDNACHAQPEACVPTWCDAPLIECGETPITGTDSCGNTCTKPSEEWPNCIEPAPEPTCADGIQYCTTSGDCTAQGYYWYNNTCNAAACVPTWCDAPLIECDQTPITGTDSCGNTCTKPSEEWPNCIEPAPEPTCADGIQYCTTSGDCVNQGYYWFNNACHVSAPTCADGIQYCTTSGDCVNQGYYWFNNACHVSAPT
ncbi:MAG: right-handed parallel beta-helix repeat-containing protein, partial [Candidatus Omnitrophica bacterium]|nr:right-handed parallel beta-helix repeat-containing protein [Candidatus Omnitrophota bacterium]